MTLQSLLLSSRDYTNDGHCRFSRPKRSEKKKIAQYNSVEPAFIHFCLVWNIHLDKFCRLEDLKPFIGAELK